jgi:diguanylate cyclase (GGDEF)-like protein
MAGLIGSALAHQIYYDNTEKLLIERTKMLESLQQAEDQLQYQAHHDYLTDLPNRSLFHDKLQVAMSESRQHKRLLALMYMDIDHFKNINDTLGHSLGDSLLQQFSLRLKECINKTATVARFGGDEFVLLMSDLNNKEPAIQTAHKILSKVQEPYQLLHKDLKITASIGLTFFTGENISADALLSQADQALYSAKKAGRNTLDIYKSASSDTPEPVY